MKKTAVFGLVFSILTGFNSALAVVNGAKVEKQTIGSGSSEDYVLGLKIEKSDSAGTMTNYCTAVIIAPNALLTASHCLRDRGARVVAVSGINIDSGKSLSVKQIFVHPLYNVNSYSDPNSQRNDIALVQLKKNISEPYRIARLPEASERLPTDQNLVVIGYGRTSLTAKTLNRPDFGKLRKGTNSIHSSVSGMITINQSIRAGLCEGDSGGPLLQQTATGFTVWGAANNAMGGPAKKGASTKVSTSADIGSILNADKTKDFCKNYGKYADVRTHLPWIRQTLSQMQ